METKSDIPLYYCNRVNLTMSLFDITFEIGVNTPQNDQIKGDEPPLPLFQHQATIMMSPQHFKAFANIVAKNLEQYEETFGTISLEKKE